MVYLIALFEATCSQVHADQTHLFGLNACDVAIAWCGEHTTYRCRGEQVWLLDLTRVATLSSDYLGEFGYGSTGMYCLLDECFRFRHTRSLARHYEEFCCFVIAELRHILWSLAVQD